MKGLPTKLRLNVELTRFPANLYQNHRKIVHFYTKCTILSGASGRTRTYNPSVNSSSKIEGYTTFYLLYLNRELAIDM